MFAAIAVVGGLAACAPGGDDAEMADETTNIAFQLGWVKNQQYAGMFVADEEGWYADAGISVEFFDGGDVASTAAVVAGGGADMGIVSNVGRLVDAIREGAELVVVGALLQDSPAGIMTLEDRPIATAEDLIGLRIGADESGQNDINALFAVNDLEPDWELVRVGFDAAPLFEGQIDAYYAYVTSQPIGYQLQGITVNTITFGELGLESYGDLVVTTPQFLEENEQAVRDFMAATARGFESAADDPENAVEITMAGPGANLGLDKAAAVAALEAQLKLMITSYTDSNGLFAIELDRVTGPMYDALKASGRDSLPDAKSVFLTGYWK